MRRLDFSMVDPFQSMISMDYNMDSIAAEAASGKRQEHEEVAAGWKMEGGRRAGACRVCWVVFLYRSAEQPIKRKREGQNEFNNRCAQQMRPQSVTSI